MLAGIGCDAVRLPQTASDQTKSEKPTPKQFVDELKEMAEKYKELDDEQIDAKILLAVELFQNKTITAILEQVVGKEAE